MLSPPCGALQPGSYRGGDRLSNSRKRDDLQPVVRGALKALDEDLRQLLLTYGDTTSHLCYFSLHDKLGDVDVKVDENRVNLFWEWCDLHPTTCEHFRDLVTQHTLPSIFRAYFDVYVEMMAALGIRRIARHDANGKRSR